MTIAMVRETPESEIALSQTARDTVASALVEGLVRQGVRQAFGVSGGAMATLWHVLSASSLQVCHFRHESGAAFAAVESHFATERPVIVFTTTGPGLTNALTGLMAARGEGAKVILVSAYSSASSRDRFAIQETSCNTMPCDLHRDGPLFHFATVLENPDELSDAIGHIAQGCARRGGFVAHLALPTSVQAAHLLPSPIHRAPPETARSAPANSELRACARLLASEAFAIWVGFGARQAAPLVLRLAEHCGAPVFCTPRAKGILPETHPLFVGVTGMGGHDSVAEWLDAGGPRRILVLGSRLGEASSLFDARFARRHGFVHVDIDPTVPGVAYPRASTVPVVADIATFLRGLLAMLPTRPIPRPTLCFATPRLAATSQIGSRRVRPELLMDAVQRHVIDTSDATVLAESGNAFIWATHRLRFSTPGRYRVSTGFGAMGHAATGVLGVALTPGRRAVALVGDGSMLMQNEINTAVKYGARAIWVVLNDARYGMCAQGMQTLGLVADALFPAVDFALMAQALGAKGVRVHHEHELDGAFCQAMQAMGPFVIDVLIDPEARAPSATRNRGLARQIADDTVVDVAFPPR